MDLIDIYEDPVQAAIDEATRRSSQRTAIGWINDLMEYLVPGSRTAVPTAPAIAPAPNPLPGLLLIGAAGLLIWQITIRNRRS